MAYFGSGLIALATQQPEAGQRAAEQRQGSGLRYWLPTGADQRREVIERRFEKLIIYEVVGIPDKPGRAVVYEQHAAIVVGPVHMTLTIDRTLIEHVAQR